MGASSLEDAVERDKFLSPQEALKFGLIDHVLSHEDIATTWYHMTL